MIIKEKKKKQRSKRRKKECFKRMCGQWSKSGEEAPPSATFEFTLRTC